MKKGSFPVGVLGVMAIGGAIGLAFMTLQATSNESKHNKPPVTGKQAMSNTSTIEVYPSPSVLRRDIETLAERITLPFQPVSVVWFETVLTNPDNQLPGPTDSRLDAVLEFNDAEVTQLVALAERRQVGKLRRLRLKGWYPDELKSSANELPAVEYSADDFFRVPYDDGKLFRIDGTGYFVLKLLSL